MTWIPNEEDFARAKRMMAEDFRNLNIVEENVKQQFTPICPIHSVFIVPQQDVNFRAYVFLNKDRDLEVCKLNGVINDLMEFIRKELERVGRGKKNETTIAFEFDSDENVGRMFGGDYFERLR